MKHLFSFFLLYFCFFTYVFADQYEILEISTQTINIGGVDKKVGDQFSDSSPIKWTEPKQFMRARNLEKAGAKGKKFYRAAFEQKKVTSIADYYNKINHLSTMGPNSSEMVTWYEGNNKSEYAEKRMALVIGNSEYINIDYLVNPVGDAILVAEKLQSLGFDVATCFDGRIADMKRSLNTFCEKAKGSDVVLFYYAGHGIQDSENSINYMLPVNINLDEDYVNSRNCLSGLDIRDNIHKLKCNVNILLFDACRSDFSVRGLGSAAFTMEAGDNTVVLYSTSNGTVAYDGYKGGKNGPFATAFIEKVGVPGTELSQTLKSVQMRVGELSKSQMPSINDNVVSEFFFEPYTTTKKKSLNTNEDNVSQNKALFSAYNDYCVKGVSFRMIRIPGGTFQMGATEEQILTEEDEFPVHSATLSSYCIGETEVTQALWNAVMGTNPSWFKGDDLPVDQVSWYDCQDFVDKLNQLTGLSFRLPTEAEWEFAARGGNNSAGYQYSGSNSIEAVAWVSEKERVECTHVVKSKSANELGLYDMSGNVWEWCQDWYDQYSNTAQINPLGPISGSKSGNRVIRGGAFFTGAKAIRVANRSKGEPDSNDGFIGFRLAL